MKIRCFVSLCVVAALLCACGGGDTVPIETRKVYTEEKTIVSDKYTIYQEEGTWFMEFPAVETVDPSESKSDQDADGERRVKSYPRFNSVYDMQEQIITGTLSDSDIALLKEDSRDGKLEICNPYDLQNVIPPINMDLEYVLWHGNVYYFRFRGSMAVGQIRSCTKEDYEYEVEIEQKTLSAARRSAISEVDSPDRNARVIHYMINSTERKKVIYEMHIGEYDFYAAEDFLLDVFEGASYTGKPSSEIPQTVRLYWNDGERYYFGYFSSFTERPTEEWITGFRVVPIA